MKRGMFLLMMIGLLAFNVNAQKELQTIDSVYVAGAVKYVTPTFDNSFDGSVYYDGVVGFIFDVTNYVDTLTVLIFEGGYEGVGGAISYVPIDTLTELNGSQTYGFYQTPPLYKKYRMRAPLVSGDTATLKNIIYYEKVSKK